MTKRTGFLITATYFLPIDKKNFAAQAATFSAIADIEKTGKLPADLAGELTTVEAPQGSTDAAPVAEAAPNPDEPVLPSVAEADHVNAKVKP